MNIYKINTLEKIPKGSVVSIGMFDGVHCGHKKVLQTLQHIAKQQDTEAIVVTFDTHPRYVLGSACDDFFLLNSNAERYKLIAETGICNILEIEFTREIASLSACQFFKKYLIDNMQVTGLLLGYDNMFGNKQNNDFDRLPQLAKQHNISIYNDSPEFFGDLKISSTEIRKALLGGCISLANSMLAYNYSIEGLVVDGRKVGRKIGFPTANIQIIDKKKMIPADGVYCTMVNIGNQDFMAVCNIGTKPTFGNYERTCEVHILDFSDDIYGKTLNVRFCEKIRDIKKFEMLQMLVNQINKDINFCKNYFNEVEDAKR